MSFMLHGIRIRLLMMSVYSRGSAVVHGALHRPGDEGEKDVWCAVLYSAVDC